MEQPKYEPGQHVEAVDDNGEWSEAWIVGVIPTYEYTIRRPADRWYDGRTIAGVFKCEKDIREDPK